MNRYQSDDFGEEARLSGSSRDHSRKGEVPYSPSDSSNDRLVASTRTSGGSSSRRQGLSDRPSSHSPKYSSSRQLRSSSHDKHRTGSSERRSSSRPSRDKHSSSSSRDLYNSPSSHDKHGRSGSQQRRSSSRKSTPTSDEGSPRHSSRRKLKSDRDLSYSPHSPSESNRSSDYHDRHRDRDSSRRKSSSRNNSYRKSSSERVSRSSRVEGEAREPSYDRHHDSRRRSSRPLHEKSSSERKLSRSPHRRSSRHRSSSRKPDSMISPGSILENQEYDDNNEASPSWGSPQDRKYRDDDNPNHASISTPPFTSRQNAAQLGMLYGTDDDAKAKGKSRRRGGSERVISPGVEHFASNNSVAANSVAVSTLYGDDADAKAKAKASRGGEGASYPGVDRVSTSPWRTKSARGSVSGVSTSTGTVSSGSRAKSETASIHDTDEHSVHGTVSTTSTLYGSEADVKAKARAGRGGSNFACNPGVDRVHYDESVASTTDTLYGTDADAKAKARASKYKVSPGVSARTGSTVGIGSLDESARSGSSVSLDVPFIEDSKEEEAPVARKVSIGSTDSGSSRHDEDPERNPLISSETAAAARGIQMPNDPDAPPRDDDGSVDKRADEKRKSRKRRCLFLLFLLLAGGGVAAWYFLFRNDGNSNEDAQINSSDIQDPSSAPSSSSGSKNVPVVPLATSSPSMSPSDFPTQELLYERPSESDCDLIAKNQTIAGREEMEKADFGLDLEVVLADNATMTEPLLDELMGAIQEKLLPSLAGCSIIVDRFLEAWRFVIFDAFVKGRAQPEETCLDEEVLGENCHRVFAELALFLKGDVRFLDIIRLISDEYENFSNHLGLSDQFLVVQMIGIKGLTPTAPPTMMPSETPSVSPSESPTAEATPNPTSPPSKATPNPTSLPSKAPTMLPTSEGSISPTSAPSLEPSSMPSTGRPSSNPSLEPTRVPTESPSAQPTVMFSGQPTSRPTKDPSARPTDNPTISPSESPSASPSTSRPSSSPSASPSGAPSPYPSSAPTVTPSMRPSASPTPPPSPVPSRVPTRAPVNGK
mmetsp:Transcript_12526/g.29911  ORF Transcript_12526/g.29911 Transcript_12526/m.29911 type:complete len:1047 (+) Transcript_12526:100-3240(+)